MPAPVAEREDYGPPVDPVTRELRYTSVSAIEKFDHRVFGGCETRWYLKYVMRVKEPQTKNQLEGIRAHEQIQHYLTTGQDVLGPKLTVGRHFLPTPGADLMVERKLSTIRPTGLIQRVGDADGVPLVGGMDWVNPRGEYVSSESKPGKVILLRDPEGTIELGDNKTTSSLQWAKGPEEILNSTQMNGYASTLIDMFPAAMWIRLSHVTFEFGKKRQAVKNTALISVETVKANWYSKGHSVVRRMRGIAKAQSVEEVPKNEASCEAFRGCPHLRVCFKSPFARLRKTSSPTQSLPEGTHMPSLLSRVKKPDTANGSAPRGFVIQDLSTTPDRPMGSAVTPPVASTVSAPTGLTASKAQQGQVYQLPNGVVAMFLSAAPDGKFTFIPTAGGTPLNVDGMDPIAAHVLTPTSVAAAMPPPPSAGVATPVQALVQTPPPVAQTPPPIAEASAVPEETKKTTRRVKGAKETEPAVEGLHLFVDCVPGRRFMSLDTYVSTMVKKLAEICGVDDIRCPPNSEHPLAFGKWKGELASAVREQPPENGIYVAFSRNSELTQVVVEALVPLCGENVTRAV